MKLGVYCWFGIRHCHCCRSALQEFVIQDFDNRQLLANSTRFLVEYKCVHICPTQFCPNFMLNITMDQCATIIRTVPYTFYS